MNSTLRDARLHYHPRVTTHGDVMRLATKILTPARLTAALYLFWLPLRSVARAILFVLGPWAGGAYAGFWPCPDDLPFNWRALAIAAGVALVLWLTERATNFPLTRLVIGKRLVISITPDTVRVACGFFASHSRARNGSPSSMCRSRTRKAPSTATRSCWRLSWAIQSARESLSALISSASPGLSAT